MANIKQVLYTHHCELPPEDDIVVKYIHSGLFVLWRRVLKRQLIVDPTSARAIAFMRSQTAIRYEQRRNLQFYYYTIHPFSKLRKVWEEFLVVLLTFTLFVLPLQVADENMRNSMSTIWACVDFILLVDIILTFYTGRLNPQTRKIILDKKFIAKAYCKSLFIPDLISCVNIDLIRFLTQNYSYTWSMRVLVFFKLLRISTLLTYLERIRENWQISVYKFKIIILMLIPIIALLWFGAAFFIIGLLHEESWLKKEEYNLKGYLHCYVRSINCFFLLGVDQVSQFEVSLIVEMLSMTIGLIFYLFVMAQILQIVNKYNSSFNKYYQITQEMGEYMNYKRLPESLRQRILEYFLFRFQKNFYKESEIMSTISVQLQEAVIIHLCKTALESVPIFKDLPSTLLVRIVTAMKSEIYLPNDVIVNAGSYGESMFFITTGTVAVYTSYGKEVAHLVDGSYFGEIALVLENERRVSSVVAVEPCELFNLSRKDFQKAIQPYPEYHLRIKKLAQDRLQKKLREIAEREAYTHNYAQHMLLEKYNYFDEVIQ